MAMHISKPETPVITAAVRNIGVVDQLIDLPPGPDEFTPWAHRTKVLAKARNKQKTGTQRITQTIEHFTQKSLQFLIPGPFF